MEITTLTAERSLELLEEVVTEAGEDYVYSFNYGYQGTCVYVSDGKPACLVGRVLAKHGVPVQELAAWDNLANIGASAIDQVNAPFITDEALKILLTAQLTQDDGATWGQALCEAKAEL